MSTVPTTVRQPHPPGLYVLFFTEMWERFSFYTMAAVFMYYLRDAMWAEQGHTWLRDYASLINGLYIGTVYFSPFFGGILADRRIGYFWSIVMGSVFFCVGQFLLAMPTVPTLFLGLLGLVIGNGLFKPNISTLVGKLYPQGDPRRDDAYVIFYMGINIGALLAPFVAGYLRSRYGFHAAFAAAGVGMIICLAIFLTFRHLLVLTSARDTTAATEQEPDAPADVQRNRNIALLIIFTIVALFWMAFKQNAVTLPLWFQNYTDRATPAALHGSPFVDETNRYAAELNAVINPFFVIAFSPLMVLFWSRLRARGAEPTTPTKVGLGMVFGAAGFAVLMAGGWAGADAEFERQKPIRAEIRRQLDEKIDGESKEKADVRRRQILALQTALDAGAMPGPKELDRQIAVLQAEPSSPERNARIDFLHDMKELQTDVSKGQATELVQVSPWFLVWAYVFITLGELCVSPLGLSLVSKLASRHSRSGWMGGWFAATAIGGYLSGLIGQFWTVWTPSQFFGVLTGAVLFAAVLLVIFLRRLNAAMPAAGPTPKLPEVERTPPVRPAATGDKITRKGDVRE